MCGGGTREGGGGGKEGGGEWRGRMEARRACTCGGSRYASRGSMAD